METQLAFIWLTFLPSPACCQADAEGLKDSPHFVWCGCEGNAIMERFGKCSLLPLEDFFKCLLEFLGELRTWLFMCEGSFFILIF